MTKHIRKIIYLFITISFVSVAVFFGIYFKKIYSINQEYYEKYNTDSPVALRKFPYPFKAAMAINSDIDNTETVEEFIEIQKFLNTRKMTSMGEGIGLEIGNSFFFYEPPTGAISYFFGGPEVAKAIVPLIRAGYIDTIHSFGKKLDFSRKDAIDALRELNNNNCKVDIWVDHSRTSDNFGDDVTMGFGDHPGLKEYHSDLMIAYGIKFAWIGRVTMITGQSVPVTFRTFTSIFDAEHSINSILNITKEFTKNVLGVFGNKKYAMHKKNDLVKITELDDGQKVYEFMRFDNYWQGVATGADSKGLAYVISRKTLDRLKDVGGYMIVYTHLGRNSDCSQYVCKKTQSALRNLAEEYEAGNIYVTTTSKLLNYYVNHKYLNWSYELNNGELNIHIYNVKDPIFGTFIPTAKDLQGITFYVPDKNISRIFIDEKEIIDIQRNSLDYTGRESVTIPLTFLKYPAYSNSN